MEPAASALPERRVRRNLSSATSVVSAQQVWLSVSFQLKGKLYLSRGANFMSLGHGVAFIFSMVSEYMSSVRDAGSIHMCIL